MCCACCLLIETITSATSGREDSRISRICQLIDGSYPNVLCMAESTASLLGNNPGREPAGAACEDVAGFAASDAAGFAGACPISRTTNERTNAKRTAFLI